MATLQEVFCNLTRAQIQDMQRQKIEVFRCVMEAPSALLVPQGWLLMERSVKGPLIFGMRKSFFVVGDDAQKEYTCAGMSLGNPERHAGVLHCISNATEQLQKQKKQAEKQK